MKKSFFVHRLHRPRDIVMALFQRLTRIAPRTSQELLELRTKHLGAYWRPTVEPINLGIFVMIEVGQIQLEPALWQQTYNLVHGVQVYRFSIGREPHDFVLVTVIGKSQVLSDRLVKGTKRMRKIHTPIHRQAIASTYSPSCAREISETID